MNAPSSHRRTLLRGVPFGLTLASAPAVWAQGLLKPPAGAPPANVLPNVTTAAQGPRPLTLSTANKTQGRDRYKLHVNDRELLQAEDEDPNPRAPACRSRPSGCATLAALKYFALEFSQGARRIHEASVWPTAAWGAVVSLRDRASQGTFESYAGWINIPGSIGGIAVSQGGGDYRLMRPGRPEVLLPLIDEPPGDHVLALSGFILQRTDGVDANVRAFGVGFTTVPRVSGRFAQFTLTDDSGAHQQLPFSCSAQWVAIPKDRVVSTGTVQGGAGGRVERGRIPAGLVVITGFRLEFLNAERPLKMVKIDTANGGVGYLRDSDAAVPASWSISYAELRLT